MFESAAIGHCLNKDGYKREERENTPRNCAKITDEDRRNRKQWLVYERPLLRHGPAHLERLHPQTDGCRQRHAACPRCGARARLQRDRREALIPATASTLKGTSLA